MLLRLSSIPIPHPLLKSHSFPTSFKTSFPRMPQLLAPPPRRLRPPRRSSSASPVRSSTSSIRTTASSLRAVIFPSSASGRETTPSPCTRASPKRSNGLWQRMRPPWKSMIRTTSSRSASPRAPIPGRRRRMFLATG